jgi:hypothetical protein
MTKNISIAKEKGVRWNFFEIFYLSTSLSLISSFAPTFPDIHV